jgi:hypothetical protein
MSTQEAFDTVGLFLQACYDRWDRMERHVPRWSWPINRELDKYIEGIKNVVRANLYWRLENIPPFPIRTDSLLSQQFQVWQILWRKC